MRFGICYKRLWKAGYIFVIAQLSDHFNNKLISQLSLRKPIDCHWFKNVLLEFFSLQLCLFFSNKIMKFYKGICSVWTSRTPVERFFSQIDVISVLKKQQKYLRSIERYFSGFFQTDLMGGISSAIQKLRKYLKDTVVLTLPFIMFKMAKHTLTILRCSPQDF